MATPKKLIDAVELQNKLRGLLGHNFVTVRPHGRNLLIEVLVEKDITETIARLSEIHSNFYTVFFRTHTGRWEQLPGEGSLVDMAKFVVDSLGPYLHPDNY
jgi:hypothetical protein